jgi:hypothetical protein
MSLLQLKVRWKPHTEKGEEKGVWRADTFLALLLGWGGGCEGFFEFELMNVKFC